MRTRYLFGHRVDIWSTGKVEIRKQDGPGTFGVYVKVYISPERRNAYCKTQFLYLNYSNYINR